jgi:hypothetical protein
MENNAQPVEPRPIRPMAVAMFEQPYKPDQQARVAAVRRSYPDLSVETCGTPSPRGKRPA